MPSYLSLLNWTDQGIHNIKDGPQRLEAAKQAIPALGQAGLLLPHHGLV